MSESKRDYVEVLRRDLAAAACDAPKVLSFASPPLLGRASSNEPVGAKKAFQYERLLRSDSSPASQFRGTEGDCPDNSWNERFQQALALPEITLEQKLRKYTLLNEINRDFISAAVVYARTIISEYFIPDEEKSLRPQAIGGQAGEPQKQIFKQHSAQKVSDDIDG